MVGALESNFHTKSLQMNPNENHPNRLTDSMPTCTYLYVLCKHPLKNLEKFINSDARKDFVSMGEEKAMLMNIQEIIMINQVF
jgi:hypothetical protein